MSRVFSLVPVSGSSTDSRFNMAAPPITAEELEDLREAFTKIGKIDQKDFIYPQGAIKKVARTRDGSSKQTLWHCVELPFRTTKFRCFETLLYSAVQNTQVT